MLFWNTSEMQLSVLILSFTVKAGLRLVLGTTAQDSAEPQCLSLDMELVFGVFKH